MGSVLSIAFVALGSLSSGLAGALSRARAHGQVQEQKTADQPISSQTTCAGRGRALSNLI